MFDVCLKTVRYHFFETVFKKSGDISGANIAIGRSLANNKINVLTFV